MVISDEIQCGFGRCGPVSIAVDAGVDPDAVLLGKQLGGGVLPLSAVIASDDLYRPLLQNPFIHTSAFSGHPLSCAAGLETPTSGRVAIARALINKPSLLLADEPTGNLDARTGRTILDVLVKLHKERRQTMLLVTHDPNVAKLADRTVHLAEGRIRDA